MLLYLLLIQTDSVVLPDDIPLMPFEASDAFQFDHGCQFFCALNDLFLEKIKIWQKEGIAEEWGGKCTFVTNHVCGDRHNVDLDSLRDAVLRNTDFL